MRWMDVLEKVLQKLNLTLEDAEGLAQALPAMEGTSGQLHAS